MNKNNETRTDLKGKTFFIHTFGCQMNENDSEHITGILQSAGARFSKSPEESDIFIVNTCAVRGKSEEKLFSLLGRLKLLKKNSDVFIGIAGCVAQLYRSELLKKNPNIDFVVGPDNYWRILEIIPEMWKKKVISTDWHKSWHEIPDAKTVRESDISGYITIMEGCNNFCSYCVVPFTRGREKFRPIENILNELGDLARKGYKEIQFLGQNVNSYQDQNTKEDFSHLLRESDQIEGIEWIRFITSHPKNLSREIAKNMKYTKKTCHQLHLPIQSGSTPVLKRMNRGYTRDDYLKKIDMLRNLMPDISLSTDIIVGYPGESETEFQESMSLLKTIGFTNIFSFRYSPRPFTAAAKLEDSVPLEEKRRRLIELQNLQKNLQLNMNRSKIGQVIKVLCTGKSKKDKNIQTGRNEGSQVINFFSEIDVTGKFVEVRITRCGPYSLFGEISNK